MKKLLLLITVLFAAPTADAMSFARRALNGVTKVAYYTPITLYSAFQIGTRVEQAYYPYHLVGLQDADEKTTQFVHENLAAIGLKNPTSVRVKVDPYQECAAADTFHNTVIVSPCLFGPLTPASPEEIAQVKAMNMPITAAMLGEEHYNRTARQAFVIQHEGGHLKHHDGEYGIGIEVATPIATTYSAKKIINRLIKNKTNNPTIVRMLSRIPGGIGLCAASYLGTCLAWQYLEQRADDTVSNDKELLKAGALKFQEIANWVGSLDNRYGHLLSLWFDPKHPSPHARYKRFQARLDALEKQNKE